MAVLNRNYPKTSFYRRDTSRDCKFALCRLYAQLLLCRETIWGNAGDATERHKLKRHILIHGAQRKICWLSQLTWLAGFPCLSTFRRPCVAAAEHAWVFIGLQKAACVFLYTDAYLNSAPHSWLNPSYVTLFHISYSSISAPSCSWREIFCRQEMKTCLSSDWRVDGGGDERRRRRRQTSWSD